MKPIKAFISVAILSSLFGCATDAPMSIATYEDGYNWDNKVNLYPSTSNTGENCCNNLAQFNGSYKIRGEFPNIEELSGKVLSVTPLNDKTTVASQEVIIQTTSGNILKVIESSKNKRSEGSNINIVFNKKLATIK